MCISRTIVAGVVQGRNDKYVRQDLSEAAAQWQFERDMRLALEASEREDANRRRQQAEEQALLAVRCLEWCVWFCAGTTQQACKQALLALDGCVWLSVLIPLSKRVSRRCSRCVTWMGLFG